MNVERTSSAAPEAGHHLLLELGRGGTAQVFLAVQSGAEGVDKLVVLKFLRPDLADNPELREMFINEARFSARLNHANIVQTSAIVQTGRGTAIVLEYLEGQPLSVVRSRARTKLPLEMHLRIIIDVLRGLHYAHELTGFDGEPLDVVHRDVSPHNVFVTYDGQVKLIDFGIAKLMGGGAETATGVIKGKIGYMPPEQLEGNHVDRRADLYAVGVMLWEAVTGVRMWRGLTDVAIMSRVMNGEVPRPRDVNPDVPEDLERIIVKTLSFAPEDRYVTASELEAELEAFVGGMTPVTNRDVGRFVSREFEDMRAETRRIIAHEMKRRATMTRSPTQVDLMPPPTLAQSLAPAGYTTTTGSESGRTDAQAPAQDSWLKRAFRPLLIAAVLGIGFGVVLGLTTRSSSSVAPSQSAAPAPAAPQSPVSVASAAVPATGKPAPVLREETAPPSGSDAAAATERSAKQAEPTTEQAEPTTEQAEPTTEQAEARATQAEPRARQAPRAKAPAQRGVAAPPEPAAKPTAAAPASPPAASCDPPYTIDAEGIKRFKVECM
ncbi:serine/threonine protein kinase [Sorangium sp. So ce1335]|uniref:serine/threonine protein kinase n=1 Tax=Sorangium sp. So ce1335 TaxID=3133335 RepID=UPI003F6448F5